MRVMILLLSLFSSIAFAKDLTIADWKETQGITEQEALVFTLDAIDEELSSSRGDDRCGVEDIWGLSREKDLIADFPEKRGPIFSITAYVKGPHSKMGCAGNITYDCRVVFSKPPRVGKWGVEYTECEPAGSGGQQFTPAILPHNSPERAD